MGVGGLSLNGSFLSLSLGPSIALALRYDLTTAKSYAEPGAWGAAELSMRKGAARRFSELCRTAVLDFGKALGLSPKLTGYHIDNLQPLDDVLIRSTLAAAGPGRINAAVDAGGRPELPKTLVSNGRKRTVAKMRSIYSRLASRSRSSEAARFSYQRRNVSKAGFAWPSSSSRPLRFQ